MQISKTIIKIPAFLLVFVLINNALTFVLSPFKGSGEEMWSAYEEMDKLDMVYAGSSQCISDINPEVIDEKLGSVSFNMGTNMQSFHNSYIALSAAIAGHGDSLRRVVLVVDQEMLDLDRYENFRAEAAFYHAMSIHLSKGAISKMSDDLAFATDRAYLDKPASLNYLFPWIYDRNPDPVLNVREKLAGRILEENGHRTDRGFLPSDELIGDDLKYVTLDEAAKWAKTDTAFQELSLSAEVEEDLRNIAALCRDNNVELIPITVPYPTFVTIYSLSDYTAMNKRLTALFADYGFDYYDFNLTDKACFDPKPSYFKDQGHMNTRGANEFGAFLADFIGLIDKGGSTDDVFVDLN